MVAKKSSSKNLKSTLGSIWNLFSDEKCWEIIIDSYDEVHWSNGKEIFEKKIFKNSKELDLFIINLLKFSKKKIDENELSHFFHLDDFTRVNIVLPPLAIKGPSVIITKLPKKQVTLDDLITWKALDLDGKNILEKILKSDKGFLVAGNMGSGKTTLLNTLVNSIQPMRRIVTLERTPDLILNRPLLTRLQSQTQKASEMIELVALAERMRADYVVLSDVQGPEIGPFIEMVRSNTSGIALTTGENIFDTVKRIATKTVLSSDGFSLEEANYALAQTFSYIIFQERRANGLRVISSICETNYDNGELKLNFIYKK